jgi:tRNA threonylcarbamoyladenosine biosynthesis protein TsaE
MGAAPEEGGGPGDQPVVVTSEPRETERVGAELARELEPGDVVLVSGDVGAGKTTLVRGAVRELARQLGAVVLVSGDVGAGKTTLVRGAVRELGHGGRVTSPTFTIVNRYEDGRVPVSHLDLYRLGETGLDGEDPSLLADELAGDRIAFIEWPEAAAHEPLGRVAVRVVLRHAGGDRREIEIERPDAG